MTDKSPHFRGRYRFGPFLLDARRRLLWRGDVHVPVTPKTVEVLCVLVSSHGTVVEKAELMKAVWPNTFVEDNNLARHVSTLRRALAERKGQPEYISTIAGHGYMFVAAVTEMPDAEDATATVTATSSPDSSTAAVPLTAHAAPSANLSTPAGPAAMSNIDVVAPATIELRPLAVRLGLVAAVATAALVTASVVNRPAAAVRRAEPRLVQLTFDGGVQRDPSWAPDGRRLVYAGDMAGNLDLYVIGAADAPPVRLTFDEADESQPDWSPDGQSIVFRSEKDGGGLFVMPAAGGPSRRIARVGYYPRWSPDGTHILFRDALVGLGPRAFIVDAAGSEPPVALRPEILGRFRSASFAWHPDGGRISIAGSHADAGWAFMTVSHDGPSVVASTLDPDMRRRLQARDVRLGEFAWSRTRREVYFQGRGDDAQSLWRVNVDPATLAWTSGPERVSSGPGHYADLNLSPDGRRLAFSARSERTRVWRFPFDPASGRITGPGGPLVGGSATGYDVSAPIDGDKVAYRTIRGNRQELWARSVPDGRERLLHSGSDALTTPRWSRDGTRVAFLRSDLRPGGSGVSRALAILPVDGGSAEILSLPTDMNIVPDDWSADGDWILAACRPGPGQPRGTCLVPTSRRADAEVRLVAFDPTKTQMCQRFSPDGKWISLMAVDLTRPDVSTLYVMPAAGGPWTAVTDGRFYDDKPRWSPDGRAVYFLSVRDGAANVWGRRFDPASGRPVGDAFRVTSLSSPQETLPRELGRAELAISRNSLFVPVTETTATIWTLDEIRR